MAEEKKVRIRVTVVHEIEVPVSAYHGETDPQRIAEMEQDNLDSGAIGIEDLASWETVDYKYEACTDESEGFVAAFSK